MDVLIHVEDTEGKNRAQSQLEKAVTASLQNLGVGMIGFPGGNAEETIYTSGQGQLWCAFGLIQEAAIPRRWNAFGVYESARPSQTITVEINIPTTTNSALVAGFFARNPVTGAVYLMHDGGVGGGQQGIGRSAYLSWSGHPPTAVECSSGDPRYGILIGHVDSNDLPSRIWHFVQSVRKFKDAVGEGDLRTASALTRIGEWDKYQRESSGRRRGRRKAQIDYVSYHGDVVDLLKIEREGRQASHEYVSNSPLIDLFVKSDGEIIEIYEVKTSLERQSLYTAIGQLITHSGSIRPDINRILVVPEGDVPDDLQRCINTLKIKVRRFRLTNGAKPRVVLI